MIRGIGVDMVSIERMRRVHDRSGDRFAKKILTSNELIKYNSVNDKVRFLSKCWAVKEATFKAQGDDRLDMLNDVEYDSPNVKICDQLSDRIHLSLSDDNGYVVAFVIMEYDEQ